LFDYKQYKHPIPRLNQVSCPNLPIFGLDNPFKGFHQEVEGTNLSGIGSP
jgi:hypothetical protein